VCAVSSTHVPDRKTPIALGLAALPPVPDEELDDAAPEDVELAVPPLLDVPAPPLPLLLVVDMAPVEELDVTPPPWPPVPLATHTDDVSEQAPFEAAQPAS
jgi:hypothetical protein